MKKKKFCEKDPSEFKPNVLWHDTRHRSEKPNAF